VGTLSPDRSARRFGRPAAEPLAGAFIGHRAMLPVRQIVATARAILQTGKMDSRVPARQTDDELAELVRLFNTDARHKPGAHPRHARKPRQRRARFFARR
jgi:nitrogen fixation/metabolism regulation signal transduction histidine kinase